MDGDGVLFETVQSPVEPVPQAHLRPTAYSEKAIPEFDERDYRSHRNVYVAVHVPYSIPRHHHKHKHKKKHHRLHANLDSPSTPPQQSLPPEPKTPLDPCDRVKFILGTEETDNPCEACTHSIFTELEELQYDKHDQRMEWKETARWVKFEEDVEEGGDKWSKPHVATLSLHSLFELRSCMMKGTVLLDLEANNLAQISDYVLDDFVVSHRLDAEHREKVREALLQRHKHQSTKDHDKKFFEHIKSFGDIGRLGSTGKNLDAEGGGAAGVAHFPFSAPNLGVFSKVHRKLSSQLSNTSEMEVGSGNGSGGRNGSGISRNGSRNESRRGSDAGGRNGNGISRHGSRQESRRGSAAGVLEEEGSEENIHHLPKPDSHFMKKIPPGSEASNVLVGEVDFLSHPIIAFVRLSQGQLLGDLTEVPIPTRFLFILLAPKGNHQRYHEIGRSIATLMSDEVFHDVAYKARNREDLLAGVDEFLDKVTVLPPGEWDPQIRLEPPPQVPSQEERRKSDKKEDDKEEKQPPPPVVTCTKWPFGGLVHDVKHRYPRYWSDIRDAISLQALASVIFIFFANITPAITFGGVLSGLTNGSMGAVEMILAVSIGNFVFALFSGQPLVVLGGTGPTLIFEDIVFRFCMNNGIPYLNFRFWIGLWTALMMIVLVAANASVIMRLFTRFTEEIFSALISFIFIYEALRSLWLINVNHPYNKWILFPTVGRTCDCYQFASEAHLMNGSYENATNLGSYWDQPDQNCSRVLLRSYEGGDCPASPLEPNVFFMSIILFFGTFLLSYYLKKFRHSRFFNSLTRRIISDFAVFISVIVWVVVDVLAQVNTPKLDVPNVFQGGIFTDDNRTSFIINPFGNGLQGWAAPAAIIPALLATVLLFMDQQITALIVNRKDHKLKKGSGYHLDLLIVGILIFVHSLFGLPWVVGATVRSITHVQSLFKYSPCTAPGERPKFLGVIEQRVTLLIMAVMLGVSIMAYQALQLLPLPLLYGIFLYIGVASLYGVQFVERLLLPLMPNKYKPDYEYLRHIPNRRIYAYTLMQVVFLALLCIFRVVQQISIVFPIMVLLLVFGRWLVGFFFSRQDMEILDDPIPEKLYCKRFRDKGHETPKTLEAATDEPDGDIDIDDKADGGIPHLKKDESEFNMTQAVDKCHLWRNMVKNLDSPIPSPRRKARKHVPMQPIVVVTDSEKLDEPDLNTGFEQGLGKEEGFVKLPPAGLLYHSTAV